MQNSIENEPFMTGSSVQVKGIKSQIIDAEQLVVPPGPLSLILMAIITITALLGRQSNQR